MRRGGIVVAIVTLLLLPAMAAADPPATVSAATNAEFVVASWYGRHDAGRRTANGERYSRALRTAAHRDLPFGTVLRVTNLSNGKTTDVRINDRGPYIDGRGIDLSERAARDLAMVHDGLALVRLELVNRGEE